MQRIFFIESPRTSACQSEPRITPGRQPQRASLTPPTQPLNPMSGPIYLPGKVLVGGAFGMAFLEYS